MGRSQELLDAAREGDKKIVEKIIGQITKRSGPFTSLRRGAGVNVQDDNGYTPLHHACLRGHKDIVALLLSVDASPCIADKKGATALHLAAWKGDAEVVSMLLNHRHPAANIDSMTSDQETALLIACQFGNVDVVASLLTRGANVDLRNCKGESPLDLAAQYGRLDTVQHLLQSRPQLVEPYALPLSRKRMYDTTPLHRASKNGHREVVSTLISAGFDPNVRTLTGTALHEAATYGKASVVRILLNKGADLHATDRSGRTVQHLLNEYSEEATRRVRRIIREHIAANGYAYESEDELPPFPPVNDYSPTGYPTAGISSETHKKAKEKDHLSPPSSLINKTSHHSQSFVKKLASKFGIKAKFNSAPNISNTSRLESEAALKLDTNKNSPKKSSSSTLLIGNSKFFKRLSKREESGEIVCTDEFDTVSLDCLATLDRTAVVNRSNRSCPGFKTSLPNISENTELSDSLESFHSSDESNNKINSLKRHHAEAVNKIPKLSIFEPRQPDDPRTSNISGQSIVNEYYESYENHTVHNNDNTSVIPKPLPRPKPKVANQKNDVIYQNVDVNVHRNAPPVPAARSTDNKKSVYENVNPPLRKAPDPPKRTVLPVITEPKVCSNESSPNISRTSTLSSNDDEAIFEDILLSKKSTSFKLKKKLSLYNSESDSLRRTDSLRSDSSNYTEASALDNVDCTDDLDQNSIYMSMTGTVPNKKPEPEVKKKILFRNKTFTSTEVERNSIRKDIPKQTYDKEFLKETLAHYHIRSTGHCINKAPTVEEFIYIFNRDALYTDTPPFEKVPNKRESYFETAICFCKPRPPKHHKSFEDLLEAPKEAEDKVVIDLESLKASCELNATSFKCFCNEGTCKFHEKNRESLFNFVVKFSAINKSISTPNISLDSLPSNKKLRLSKINSIPANLEDPYAVVDVKDILSRKQSNDSDTKSINYATMSQTSTASRPYSVKDISDAMSNTASPDTSLSYNASMCIRNSSSSEISGKWSLKTCNSNTTVKSDNSFKSCIEEMISSDEDSESDETNEPSDTDTIKSDVSTAKRPWVHSDSFRFGSPSKLNDPEAILEETELITPSSDVNYGQLALELLKMTNDINNLELTNAPSTSSNNLSKSETSTSGIETNFIDFDTNTKTDDSSLECTNVESGIESETSQSDSQSDFEYKRLDSDPNQTNPSSEENDNNLEVDKPVVKDPGDGVVCEGLKLEFGGASLERGLLGAVVHSGSGRRRWDEGEGTSEGDALSLSSAASSCAPHHLVHHMEYNKVSPTPPKKPPRRNLSVSPTHANSPSGYSYDLRPHARSQDDLDDIPGAKNYLKHGRSVDQYVNSKLSYSEYEETQTPPRVPPVPNPRPSLKTRTQPVAITAMYENVIIKEQNPKRKLRRNVGPGFETNDGRPRIQERSSVESLLDDSMSPSDCERYYEGVRVDIPLSPSHYNAPPTPDHPPPSAKQAENSIHERIRPLSQEYKRRSALRNSYTETEVVLLRAPSAVSVASGATDNCVEEYVCDVPFAGLFKGSTTTLDGIGLRPMPAERPKTLKKLKSVYDTSPSEAPTSNFANITSNGTQHNQNDRQGQGTGGYGNGERVNGEDGVRRRSNTNSSCGDKSLSILSPFDEQEEWAKISEIMASFGSKLARESVFVSELEQEFTSRLGANRSEWSPSPSCASSMGSWLGSLGLGDYEGLLMQHGYDDVDFINGIIDEADLKEMGIEEAERTKILDTTKQLPNKILDISNNYNNVTSQNENVDKWLRDIKLEEYSDIFRRHLYVDMERVRRIWDVELTAVLEIQKVGHRKRILASVCGLLNGPVSNLEDINADLQCLKNNIQLLKDDIKVKLPDNLKAVPPPTVPPTAGETLKRSKKKPAPQPPKPSDLEIRAPSELLVGVPGALKTQWKHQPFVLVTGAVTYVANYLGSTVVKELKGTESTKKSIQKLKKSTKEPRDSPDIILSISYRGVKFLNTVTRELVCEHEVRNIHCACQDADDLTHFAYITKDHDTKSHYCHVFRVATMEQATEVILTLGEAFEVAYQMALREQSNRVKPPAQSRTPTHDTTNKERPQNHGRSHSITEIKLNGHQLKLAPIPTSLSTEDFQSTRSAEGNRSPRTQMLKAPIASTEEL